MAAAVPGPGSFCATRALSAPLCIPPSQDQRRVAQCDAIEKGYPTRAETKPTVSPATQRLPFSKILHCVIHPCRMADCDAMGNGYSTRVLGCVPCVISPAAGQGFLNTVPSANSSSKCCNQTDSMHKAESEWVLEHGRGTRISSRISRMISRHARGKLRAVRSELYFLRHQR